MFPILDPMLYRAHNPRWAFAPTSGRGAALYGGRFNPAGTPALYTSMRPETAWLEAQQGFPFKPQPLTLCAYEVDCDDVYTRLLVGTIQCIYNSSTTAKISSTVNTSMSK
jgi:RES domain-containing protein